VELKTEVKSTLYACGLKYAAREQQENGDFKRNIEPIGLFSQKHWKLT